VFPVEEKRAVIRRDPRIAAGVESERVDVIVAESEFRPRVATLGEPGDPSAVRAYPHAVLLIDGDGGEIVAGDRGVGLV